MKIGKRALCGAMWVCVESHDGKTHVISGSGSDPLQIFSIFYFID
jgi:hypothetical protein